MGLKDMGLKDLFSRQYYEIKLEEPPSSFKDEADFIGGLIGLRISLKKAGCSEEEIMKAREEILAAARKAHPEWGWRSVER